jgi:hypothetical protein
MELYHLLKHNFKASAAVPLLAPLRQLLSCGVKFCTAAHRRAAMPPPPAAAAPANAPGLYRLPAEPIRRQAKFLPHRRRPLAQKRCKLKTAKEITRQHVQQPSNNLHGRCCGAAAGAAEAAAELRCEILHRSS